MAEIEDLNVMLDPLSGVLGAAIGAVIVFLIALLIAYYIYTSFAMMRIAQKIGTPNAWLAWIPIGNIYLMTQMAGISGWWTFGIFAAFIPAVGGPLILAGTLYLYWLIAEKVERPGWFGILMIIPIVNLVVLGMMAWGTPDKASNRAKAGKSSKPVKRKSKQ